MNKRVQNKGSALTRTKILDAANQHFADFGYGGAKIRDIAASAQVNIAAVNYHFESKKALYFENYQRSFRLIEEEAAKIAGKAKSTSDFVVKLFRFFLKNDLMVVSTFKILISDPGPEFLKECLKQNPRDYSLMAGPPGAKHLANIIIAETGRKFTDKSLLWASRVLFGCIVQWTLVSTSKHLQRTALSKKQTGETIFKKDLELLCESVLATLDRELKN